MEDLNTNAKEVKVKRTRKLARTADVQADTPQVINAVTLSTSVQIGDKPKKEINSALAAMPLDRVKASSLAIESNVVNDRNKSGKKAGAMLVTEAAHIVAAIGEGTNSAWYNQTSKAKITPAGGATSTTQSIGDGKRKQQATPICSLSIPVVLKADLAKGSHPLNDSNISGKKLGSTVMDETGLIYISLGSNWNSVWLSPTPITPSGAPSSNVSGVTGQKAKSRNGTVACVDFPVILAASVADKDHPINSTEISGKQFGSVVVTEAGDLLVAKGSAATDPWLAQVAGTEITPA